ncbi:hypothetical protein ACA040_002569 [Xenophilus aerolatus]
MASSFADLESPAASKRPSPGLRLGRHVVGMAFAALANPMLYFDSRPVFLWVATWLVPAVGAACICGLLALFFTKRARRSWPGGAIVTAWVLFALVLSGYWMTYNEAKSSANAPAAASPTTGEKRPFTYEEAAGTKP